MGEPSLSRRPALRVVLHLAVVAVLAVALRAVYGPGFVGVDAMWSLAWAEDLIKHGWLVQSVTTTPHVLSNALGLALLPFGQDADRALVALQFLGAATLVWCVAAAARVIAGLPAALLAGAVMATQEQLLFATRSGYLDVFATMLVAAAALLVVRADGKRWIGAGVMLGLAGLLRPEPWLLLALLTAGRWREDGGPNAVLVALVVAVPALWAITDLVLNDDLLYSLHQTRDASARFQALRGIDDGLVARLASIPKSELRAAGVAGVVLGGLTLVLAFWPGERGVGVRARWFGEGPDIARSVAMLRLLIAGAAVLALTVAAEAVTGTLLFARFSLPMAALLVIAGVSGLVLVVRARLGDRVVPGVVASGAVLLVIAAPLLVKARHTTDPEQARYENARAILRPGVPCRPLVVPSAELRPHAAVWAGVWAGDVQDAMDVGVAPAGSFVDATTTDGQLLSRGGWATAPKLADLDLPVVREGRGWVLKAGSRRSLANAKCGR